MLYWQVERKKREEEAAKRLAAEEAEWAKMNEQRKADGKEEQTLEDWRKEKKGAHERTRYAYQVLFGAGVNGGINCSELVG